MGEQQRGQQPGTGRRAHGRDAHRLCRPASGIGQHPQCGDLGPGDLGRVVGGQPRHRHHQHGVVDRHGLAVGECRRQRCALQPGLGRPPGPVGCGRRLQQQHPGAPARGHPGRLVPQRRHRWAVRVHLRQQQHRQLGGGAGGAVAVARPGGRRGRRTHGGARGRVGRHPLDGAQPGRSPRGRPVAGHGAAGGPRRLDRDAGHLQLRPRARSRHHLQPHRAGAPAGQDPGRLPPARGDQQRAGWRRHADLRARCRPQQQHAGRRRRHRGQPEPAARPARDHRHRAHQRDRRHQRRGALHRGQHGPRGHQRPMDRLGLPVAGRHPQRRRRAAGTPGQRQRPEPRRELCRRDPVGDDPDPLPR